MSAGRVTKTLKRLAGCGIKNVWPIFKTEMLIHPSKDNCDEKNLFGKITHLLGDPKLASNASKGLV